MLTTIRTLLLGQLINALLSSLLSCAPSPGTDISTPSPALCPPNFCNFPECWPQSPLSISLRLFCLSFTSLFSFVALVSIQSSIHNWKCSMIGLILPDMGEGRISLFLAEQMAN